MKSLLTFMPRALDFVLALSGLIILFPLMLTVAVVVRIFLGSPVLFRQLRAGQFGRPFEIVKFRTMNDRRSTSGELLPDAVRLTRLGRTLRALSLDELPQLWCVLKGDMSLVGPRPLLMEYLPLYTPEQARRHAVKPGITGWAQVNGRNALDWDQRFALDLWYVDHANLALYVRILWLSCWCVLCRSGISGDGHATMKKFGE
jgi:lipopolysaccharide/colanic/teichoic acid biosynthesis glycosyltransferase